MAKFAYNKTKNSSINPIFFELNGDYYSCIFLKKNINLCFYWKIADKLVVELKKL